MFKYKIREETKKLINLKMKEMAHGQVGVEPLIYYYLYFSHVIYFLPFFIFYLF